MTTARAAPPTAVLGHTDSTISTNTLGASPAELVTRILEFLPIDDLWSAARVSRQLYAASWTAGLFIHRNIEWVNQSGLARQLSVFKDVLKHAQQKGLRLSLSIRSVCLMDSILNVPGRVVADVHAGAHEIFSVLSSALPLLVYLSVRIDEDLRAQLDDALQYPAPMLRTFRMLGTEVAVPCVTPLPRDLFIRSAPQLHVVTIDTLTLPDDPLPAFAAVSQAAIRYANQFPPVDVGRHFPHLTKLRLEVFMTEDGGATVPQPLDFSGLSLRVLVIDDDSEDELLRSAVERSLDLSTIPVVEVIGPAIRWDDKIWTKDTAKAFIRVRFCPGHMELCIFALPAHQRWRRLHITRWSLGMPVPISTLPDLSARLAYLRIDAEVVRGFLALELAFPALLNLQVDLQEGESEQDELAPSGYEAAAHLESFDDADPAPGVPRVWAPCAALEKITLFALDEPIDRADSRSVAFLAHALGQHQRPETQRAKLALIGVEFTWPVASVLLGQTVSAISTSAFAGIDSPEDYEGGLWECCCSGEDLHGGPD